MNQITEIATLLITVALISMLVQRSQGTAQVIGAASQGFGHLLNAATLQNSMFGGSNTFSRF